VISPKRALILTLITCALSSSVTAALITNGGFESGFTGWTRMDQTGSEGTFALQTGTTSPVNGVTVPAPPGGTRAAMTDAAGPGSHVLLQTFMITAPVPTASLEFDLFVGNRADAFSTPATLDFATPTLNQQARIDILAAGADPFTTSSSSILLTALQTAVGSPLVSGYTHYSVNVTGVLNSHLNTPLTLRFAEVDNVNIFQLGVDNVDFQTSAVPEPSTWAISIGGLLAGALLSGARRLRR